MKKENLIAFLPHYFLMSQEFLNKKSGSYAKKNKKL